MPLLSSLLPSDKLPGTAVNKHNVIPGPAVEAIFGFPPYECSLYNAGADLTVHSSVSPQLAWCSGVLGVFCPWGHSGFPQLMGSARRLSLITANRKIFVPKSWGSRFSKTALYNAC